MSRRALAVGVGLVLVAAAVVARAGLWDQGGARPVPGVPLQGPTGLRLLVASGPAPVVLDVDSGAVEPVTGLPAGDDRSVHAEQVGEDAVIVSRRDCPGRDCDQDAVVYLVRHGGTVATRLAATADVEASRDGQGVAGFTRLGRIPAGDDFFL